MNGNGNGEAGIPAGAEGNGGNGPADDVTFADSWGQAYPQDKEERYAYFADIQRRTAQELFDSTPAAYKKWRALLTTWGVTAGADKWQFLFDCVMIHKERLFPMMSYWLALFGLTVNEVKAKWPETSAIRGFHTKFISDIIRRQFKVRGYEWELKIDEVIAEIGSDFRIADWLQTNINEARDRAKQRAKIRVIVTVVTLSLLTYGVSNSLGINTKVATAMADAKVAYVQGTVWNQILGWVKVITAGFKAFLDAIHYKTLVALHKIAYLVSSEYRAVSNKVYGEISRASSALGLGPHYLELFYQSARVLILDVSTSLGRGYDVAQLEWLSTFNGYLKVFNSRAYRYKNDPALLFYDLEQLVERPALDAKGAGTAAIFNTLDSLLTSTENTVTNIQKINTDVEQLVFNLPQSVREHIQPYTDKVTKKVDEFIENSYNPAMNTLNALILAIKGTQETTKGALAGVIARIAKPANYLLEIDSMDDLDRIDQENKIAGVASRGYAQDSNYVAGETHGEYVHLEAIAAALQAVIISPVTFPQEVNLPQRSAIEPATPRETWFIGDF